MTRVIVSDKALRELVREAMDNKEFSGWSSNHEGPVNVEAGVDQSAAVTDPVNPNYTPQSKTELGVALAQLVKNLPDTEMPAIFDTVKHAIDINAKKDEEETMTKKASHGGTTQTDDKAGVEESVRKAVRRTLANIKLKTVTEAPDGWKDPADVAADEDPEEPLDVNDRPKGKHSYKTTAIGGMSDVSGASFEEIAKSLGFSVAGAKQAVDKALDKARFLATVMDQDDREIMVLTAMNDYIKMLAKTGELSGSDVQLMKDHPSIVRELDGFREFLHNHVRRARKAGAEDVDEGQDLDESETAMRAAGDGGEIDEQESAGAYGHDCTKCYKQIPAGEEMEAFGTLYHKKCAPKNARPVKKVTKATGTGQLGETLDLDAINRAVEGPNRPKALTEMPGGAKPSRGQLHGLRHGQKVTASGRALIADTKSDDSYVYLNDATDGEPILRQAKNDAGLRWKQGSNPSPPYKAYPLEFMNDSGEWQAYSSDSEKGQIRNNTVHSRLVKPRKVTEND